jgi:hypothetical protein
MYSTCLFCHSSLGSNEAIEHFTVGRRLAFDAAKGRLWIVCTRCGRWNLTPLEERWEAIDECERLFRDTRLRVSTEHVGLARLREGTTLIRIGAPQRPELAAWRYGQNFGRRRTRYILVSSLAVAVGGLVVAGPLAGIIGCSAVNMYNVGTIANGFRTAARLTFDDHPPVRLRRLQLETVELRPNVEYGYELEIDFFRPRHPPTPDSGERRVPWWARRERRVLTITGNEAVRAARILLPAINVSGGRAATVRASVDLLEAGSRADEMFTRFASAPRKRFPILSAQTGRFFTPGRNFSLAHLPAAQRLALEMALHEEDERRALEGELAELEARWKEAEEIAAISDDLLVPPSIQDKIDGSRRG